MASALKCDVCDTLYNPYEVKPHHSQYPKTRYDGATMITVHPWVKTFTHHDQAMDLCAECLLKVVEEYTKAIPRRA